MNGQFLKGVKGKEVFDDEKTTQGVVEIMDKEEVMKIDEQYQQKALKVVELTSSS